MRFRFIRGYNLYGPFLINRDMEKCRVFDTHIETATEGIYAEKLTKKSKYALSALALGENNKNVCVFCTPTKPDINEVMAGLDKYVGWSDKKIPIEKVFELDKGKVTTYDANLIKDKFPEVFKDLESQEETPNKNKV